MCKGVPTLVLGSLIAGTRPLELMEMKGSSFIFVKSTNSVV